MSAELVKRADAVRARYALLESAPGTGYHDNDRNLARPELFLAPQKNGLPRASDHVVFFTDYPGEEVQFVGADAKRAHIALQAWFKKAAKLDPMSLTGTERKLIARILPRLPLLAHGDYDLLRVPLHAWNDVLFALQAEGIGLSGLPLEE